MKKYFKAAGIFIFLFPVLLCAQQYATNDSFDKLVLDNGLINRIIILGSENGGIVTTSMKMKQSTSDFISEGSCEFSFEANDRSINGKDKWKIIDIRKIKDDHGGNGAAVIMDHPAVAIRITVNYLLYADLPLIKKNIVFENIGKDEIKIEAPDIESFKFNGDDGTHTWIMHEYGRQKALGPYVGDCYDPVVVAHQFRNKRGIALGNEAPGVMKRTTAFLKPQQFTIGLTNPEQIFGFRKWLRPSEKWESTWVFTALYENTSDPYEVLNTVSDYVRLHMGTRLSMIPAKPVFIYNTWEPFLHNINENRLCRDHT